MHQELSLAARQQAEKIRSAIRSGQTRILFSARQMRGKPLRALQVWCDGQGLGPPLRPDGGWHFSAGDLPGLELAIAQLGLRPLGTAAADTRIARLQQGAEEHKRLAGSPLEHRILCSQSLDQAPLPVREAPSRWIIDIDWRQLHLPAFAGLLVVENADVFYACGSADWPLPDSLRDFLVTYRGHDYRSHGLKQLQHAWLPEHGPQVYFGDIDPQGMAIGLREGYTHLLLPSVTDFRRLASSWQAPARQSDALQWLQTHGQSSLAADHPLQPYLHVLAHGRGVLQQAVLQTRLHLIAIDSKKPPP